MPSTSSRTTATTRPRRNCGRSIDDLADDEKAELIALALVGRGTYDASEWADAMDDAAEEVDDAADFLLDLPMLAAYLEGGLAAFDLSCDGLGQVV